MMSKTQPQGLAIPFLVAGVLLLTISGFALIPVWTCPWCETFYTRNPANLDEPYLAGCEYHWKENTKVNLVKRWQALHEIRSWSVVQFYSKSD